MPDPKLVLRGENCPVKVIVNNVPQRATENAKSLKVSQDAVIHEDDYLGQTRTRPDKQLKGYDAEVEMEVADNVLLDALIAQDEAREARQPIPRITLSFLLQMRDGTTSGYFLEDCVANFDLGFGGRTDALMKTLKLKARNLKKAI